LGMDYREYVELDPALLRPAEVVHLRADPSKAQRELGWNPTVTFEELIHMMVDEDMSRVRNQMASVRDK
jgi:GDPmannose 4,6-dehydratase